MERSREDILVGNFGDFSPTFPAPPRPPEWGVYRTTSISRTPLTPEGESSRSNIFATLRLCALLFLCAFAPLRDLSAQRVALKQLERYLGAVVGPGRVGYVGLTNTNGDQEYKKLDSIIVSITGWRLYHQ